MKNKVGQDAFLVKNADGADSEKLKVLDEASKQAHAFIKESGPKVAEYLLAITDKDLFFKCLRQHMRQAALANAVDKIVGAGAAAGMGTRSCPPAADQTPAPEPAHVDDGLDIPEFLRRRRKPEASEP